MLPPKVWTSEEIYEIVSEDPKIHENGEQVEIPDKSDIHNWCKQSIFWELPYWKNLKLQHNIDVMHDEKNVFNTVLNVKGKTKDNANSRRDILPFCKRPKLHLYDGNKKRKA